MKKTVGILDDVVEYGQRLAGTINIRKNSGLRATFIRTPFEVKEKIVSGEIQILLVSERYACQVEDASVPVFILVSELVHGSSSDPGDRIIMRYSQVSDIIENLLSEANEKRNEKDEKIRVFFSPDSVEVAVNKAEDMAEKLAQSGKTLFLPFDNFYGKKDRKSLTELLYTGLGDKTGLTELLSFTKGDRYDAFGGPEHFSDLWQYSEEQMKKLLQILLEEDYSFIVIAVGFMSDAVYRLFRLSDVIYIPTTASGRYDEFIRQIRAFGDVDIEGKIKEL